MKAILVFFLALISNLVLIFYPQTDSFETLRRTREAMWQDSTASHSEIDPSQISQNF